MLYIKSSTISVIIVELNSKEGNTVYFRLNDATGIRSGTPIMYKGLKVGEVKDVMMKDNQSLPIYKNINKLLLAHLLNLKKTVLYKDYP